MGGAEPYSSPVIARDIVPLGYKVTLDDGVYTVKLPNGMKKPVLR